MLKEQGIVTAINNKFITVQTQRNSSCGGCSANKGCGTASLATILGNKSTEIQVINNTNVKIGDIVTIGVSEQSLVKSALVMYLLPLLTMFFTAISYKILVTQPSELLITIAGLIGLLIGLFIVNLLADKISKNTHYQPIVCKKD